MLSTIGVYKNLILAAVTLLAILGLYFYVSTLKGDIIDLKMTIKDMNVELANEKLQSTRYKSALDTQNEHIVQMQANEKVLRGNLAKWKNQPKEVRYQTIYKTKVVKSNECKAIKDRLGYVKSIDFNEL